MNRIDKAFQQGKVFAAYLTAGDGSLRHQLAQIRALVSAGVNLLEIGIPFSDPIADGPVIQRAMQRSLQAGTRMREVIDLIRAIRLESELPIVVFTYYNPIRHCERSDAIQDLAAANNTSCCAQLKNAGADGILVVDLPLHEADAHLHQCQDLELAPIAVIAPSTTPDRLEALLKEARGFLYYACQKGTTGMRQGLPADLSEKIAFIKSRASLPVIVGFGVADRASAQAILALADGFVVGSYFIQAIESGVSPEKLQVLALDLCGSGVK